MVTSITRKLRAFHVAMPCCVLIKSMLWFNLLTVDCGSGLRIIGTFEHRFAFRLQVFYSRKGFSKISRFLNKRSQTCFLKETVLSRSFNPFAKQPCRNARRLASELILSYHCATKFDFVSGVQREQFRSFQATTGRS